MRTGRFLDGPTRNEAIPALAISNCDVRSRPRIGNKRRPATAPPPPYVYRNTGTAKAPSSVAGTFLWLPGYQSRPCARALEGVRRDADRCSARADALS